jgi:hypothetical protein
MTDLHCSLAGDDGGGRDEDEGVRGECPSILQGSKKVRSRRDIRLITSAAFQQESTHTSIDASPASINERASKYQTPRTP